MRSTDIHSLYPETLHIPTGATCTISPIPGQLSVTVKYGSGGTLWFQGASFSSGSSFAVAQRYLIGSSDVLTFHGAGPFRLEATGATVVAYIVRGRSAGFDQT